MLNNEHFYSKYWSNYMNNDVHYLKEPKNIFSYFPSNIVKVVYSYELIVMVLYYYDIEIHNHVNAKLAKSKIITLGNGIKHDKMIHIQL